MKPQNIEQQLERLRDYQARQCLTFISEGRCIPNNLRITFVITRDCALLIHNQIMKDLICNARRYGILMLILLEDSCQLLPHDQLDYVAVTRHAETSYKKLKKLFYRIWHCL